MCLAGTAAAQHDALTGIGPGTEVRTITFDFQGEHRLTEPSCGASWPRPSDRE